MWGSKIRGVQIVITFFFFWCSPTRRSIHLSRLSSAIKMWGSKGASFAIDAMGLTDVVPNIENHVVSLARDK